MSSACTHMPGGRPEPLFIVDDPCGGVDPLLVIQCSRRRGSNIDSGQKFVEIIGELDTYSAGLIGSTLFDIAGAGLEFVLDVSGVSFLDSAGMRLLQKVHEHAAAEGGRVWLHDPSRQVQRLIDILEIDRFDVCKSVADRHHSLRHDVSPLSFGREWTWDDRTAERRVRVVELAGGPEHPGRRRFTIDASYTPCLTITRPTGGAALYDVAFTVCGELDSSAATAITAQGARCADSAGTAIMDLSRVTLIDSAGMRSVETFAAQVATAGGRFILRDPSPIVQQVLDILDIAFESAQPLDTSFPLRRSAKPSTVPDADLGSHRARPQKTSLNHPGSVVGSFYLIPTPVGAVCWSA